MQDSRFATPGGRGRPRPILQAPHPLLGRIAKPVKREELRDPLFAQLLEDGFATIAAYDLIGMAAPQIGIGKRLIFVDFIEDGRRVGPYAIINPKLELSEGEVLSTEGSPCVPGIAAEIVRHARVICVGLDAYTGKRLCLDATSMLALCLQHEIDHLNGKIITDVARSTISVDQTKTAPAAGGEPHSLSPAVGSPLL